MGWSDRNPGASRDRMASAASSAGWARESRQQEAKYATFREHRDAFHENLNAALDNLPEVQATLNESEAV